MQKILLDDNIKQILNLFQQDNDILNPYSELDPLNLVNMRRQIFIHLSRVSNNDGIIQQEFDKKYHEFLNLYFGKEALKFSTQFGVLYKMANKKYGWAARHGGDELGDLPPITDDEIEFLTGKPPDYSWRKKQSESESSSKHTKSENSPRPDPYGYFAILNLNPDTADLSSEDFERELKQAWRKIAKNSHTDVVGGKKEEFIKARRAYELLLDPKKRASYFR